MNYKEIQLKRLATRSNLQLEGVLLRIQAWCSGNLLGTYIIARSNGRRKPVVVDFNQLKGDERMLSDTYPVVYFDDKDEAELFKQYWRTQQ